MIAAAQPTPGVTVIASTGQFLAQAPHSIQPSESTIFAFCSTTVKIRWGQTIWQLPQPMQVLTSKLSVAVFGMYLKFFIFYHPINGATSQSTIPRAASVI